MCVICLLIITRLIFGRYRSVHCIGNGLVKTEQCIKSEASLKFAYEVGFPGLLYNFLECKGVHLQLPGLLFVAQIVVLLAEEWQHS